MATTTVPALQPFDRKRAALLTTFRRDGTPVATAVNLAVEGDHAYFRTFDRSWKARRLARDAHVTIAPSTMSGKTTGSTIGARTRLLSGEEAHHAGDLIDRKHRLLQGVFVHLYHRMRGYKTLHYELLPE